MHSEKKVDTMVEGKNIDIIALAYYEIEVRCI